VSPFFTFFRVAFPKNMLHGSKAIFPADRGFLFSKITVSS